MLFGHVVISIGSEYKNYSTTIARFLRKLLFIKFVFFKWKMCQANALVFFYVLVTTNLVFW